MRHHRIPPRSPNLNAFVERFQGTVLHLHYRVAFRYRYYTAAATIDADLHAFLRFYNFERPHRGYADLLIRLPAGWPDATHDMFWCDLEGYLPALGDPAPAVVPYTTMVAWIAVSELIERLVGYDQPPWNEVLVGAA